MNLQSSELKNCMETQKCSDMEICKDPMSPLVTILVCTECTLSPACDRLRLGDVQEEVGFLSFCEQHRIMHTLAEGLSFRHERPMKIVRD